MALQYQASLRDLPEVVLGLSTHDVKVGKLHMKREAEVLLKTLMINLWEACMHFIICLFRTIVFFRALVTFER